MASTADIVTSVMVTSGIQLSHSPIVFSFTVKANKSDTTEDLNQAIELTVYHGSSSDGELISCINVPSDNQTFTVDISEAVRGWYIWKNYDCSSLENLKADVGVQSFTLSVMYKCKRRDISTNTFVSYKADSAQEFSFEALEGGLTEYATYLYGATDRSSLADPYYFSLKPLTSAEVVNNGEIPYPYNAESGRTYYAESPKNTRRHRFFFINSCGLLESASLVFLEEKDIKYSTSTNKLYRGAAFKYSPNVSSSKTSSTSWKMSTGYCTREWAEWWAGEFAFAKRFWMEMSDGTLEPVTISVESATSYDKSNGSLLCVNFTVNSAVY